MKKLLRLIPLLLLTVGCTLKSSATNKSFTKSSITILDERSLVYPKKNSISFSEISDLTYDSSSHKLYMIGDKGNFYTFLAEFKDNITKLEYLSAYKIYEKNRVSKYDTEGLTKDNKGELYISFERHARVASISKKGYIKRDKRLPKRLRKRKKYRSKNKMLEALAWHKRYGLLTIAEYPLKGYKRTTQTIYSLKGKKWHFKTEDYRHSAVTAIEVIDSNSVLILERAFTDIFEPMYITLKKVYLERCNKQNICKTEVLAKYRGQIGINIDNYEGLAKVGKNRYIMVSDNNNKSILSTKLIYFKVNK